MNSSGAVDIADYTLKHILHVLEPEEIFYEPLTSDAATSPTT